MSIFKKGIRCLGIAESFLKMHRKSILVGVVMRRDLIIDGLIVTNVTVGGLDSTEKIIEMYNSLNRNDINFVLINGTIIAWYNIIDLENIYRAIKIPVISITYRQSKGIEKNLLKFNDGDKRVKIYRKNGERKETILKTGYKVFYRAFGIKDKDANILLNKFTFVGKIPEPVRIAKLIARTLLKVSEGKC